MACMMTHRHGNGVAHGGVDHVERGVERGVEGVVGAQARAQDCEGASDPGGGSSKGHAELWSELSGASAVIHPLLPLGVLPQLVLL